jgi:hypothetical protein
MPEQFTFLGKIFCKWLKIHWTLGNKWKKGIQGYPDYINCRICHIVIWR